MKKKKRQQSRKRALEIKILWITVILEIVRLVQYLWLNK